MIYRILEISLYTFMDLFFNILLAVIPFKKFFRFNRYKMIWMLLSLFVVAVTGRVIALGSARVAGTTAVILVLLYLICYRISFTVSVSKLLFVLFVILNSGSLTAICHSYLASILLSGARGRTYSLYYSGIHFLIMVFVYPLLLYMMKRKVEPLVSSGINNKAWNYLWIVPATFCFSYYYNLYSNHGFSGYTRVLGNVLFTIIYSASGLGITFLITGLVKDSNDFMQIKAENYMVSLQSVQYDYMKNYMEETRRAKHDLRQVMVVLQSGLQNNELDRLREYVSQHVNMAVPADISIHYCENFAFNALLVYYAALAEKKGIDLKADIQYPEAGGLDEQDMVVLYGNLLENAMEACARQTEGQRFIALAVKKLHDSIVITLDNSYNGKVKKIGSQFISSKNDGIGIGISSIKRLVEKYHGTLLFDCEPYIFKASIILKTNES